MPKTEQLSQTIQLHINEITKCYKKNIVYNNASFSANSGDCIALVGGNGCGKSTLLGMICGLIKPDSGKITVRLYENDIPAKKLCDYISYVPQDNFFLNELTGYDNLLFWYKCDKNALENDLASGFANDIGINDYLDKRIDKMSVGMKKRIALACALANKPKILLLDEVNAPLDIICKIKIQEYLVEYAKQGNIVIMATHDEGDVNICNRICYINNYQITESKETSLREVFTNNL